VNDPKEPVGGAGDANQPQPGEAAAAGNKAGDKAEAKKDQPSVAEGLATGVKEAGEALTKAFAAGVTAPEPAGDPEVMTAFALGWQMAELYNPGPWPDRDAEQETDLPGLSELGGSQRAQLGLDQVKVALVKLETKIKTAGLDMPSTADAEAKLPAEKLEDGYREEIFKLHVELLTTLTATHYKLGKSYGLGRALADTSRLPHDGKTLHEEFKPHRIATIEAWISDLTTLLPPHAGHSVNDSLAEWTSWADKQPEDAPLDTKILGLLRRQGELWRALLSGEKNGTDNLKFSEYVEAGTETLSQTGKLAEQFLRKYWPWALLTVVLLLGSIALIALDNNTGQIAAGIAGLLASLGISWKGIGATLGTAAAQVERPIWQAALDVEIAEAITYLPDGQRAQNYTPPQPRSVV
jgi:hypothetical protein